MVMPCFGVTLQRLSERFRCLTIIQLLDIPNPDVWCRYSLHVPNLLMVSPSADIRHVNMKIFDQILFGHSSELYHRLFASELDSPVCMTKALPAIARTLQRYLSAAVEKECVALRSGCFSEQKQLVSF